jgi:hypothetical protein
MTVTAEAYVLESPKTSLSPALQIPIRTDGSHFEVIAAACDTPIWVMPMACSYKEGDAQRSRTQESGAW